MKAEMTAKEFTILIAKLQAVAGYEARLQKKYQGQTGARFITGGPLPPEIRKEALREIRADILKEICHA